VKKISCDVIIENKYPKMIWFFFNELDVKKGQTNMYMFLWTNRLCM